MITIEIVVGAVVHGAVDVLCQCQATVRGRLTFVRYSAVQYGTVLLYETLGDLIGVRTRVDIGIRVAIEKDIFPHQLRHLH